MKRTLILIIIFSIFLANCVSTGENIKKMNENDYKSPDILNIDIEKIKTIDNWTLKFKYENVTLETKELSDGSFEKTKTDFGYNKHELQLIDSIYYSLKYQYKINIEKNIPADGVIEINVLFDQIDSNEYNYSIEIIFSTQNSLLARNLYRKIFYIDRSYDGYSEILNDCINIILTRLNK